MIKVLSLVLGLCPTEDGTNCVWNAQIQGNGVGVSFVALSVPMTNKEIVVSFLGW